MSNYAVIDLGSNSVRLQIARPTETGYEVIYEAKEPVRLGENVFITKMLAPQAMDRTIAVLKQFAQKLEEYGVSHLNAVTTSAVRSSQNKDIFLSRVRAEIGIDIDVISGEEEGKLIGLGLLNYPYFNGHPYLLIDIGGGSTEISYTDGESITFTQSLELGAVRLTEMFVRSDPISHHDHNNLINHIASVMNPVISQISSKYNFVGVIGTSGTVAVLSSIDRANKNLPNIKGQDYLLEKLSISSSLKKIKKLNYHDRLKIKGIDKKRAEIIVAGASVLEHFMNSTGMNNIWVSQKGLKDGLMIKLLSTSSVSQNVVNFIRPAELINEDIDRLAEKYDTDKTHSMQVSAIAVLLYEQLVSHNLIMNNVFDKFILYSAAKLHDIGHSINHINHHKHTDYIIRNSAKLTELDADVVLAIASVARSHRLSAKKVNEKIMERHKSKDINNILRLAAILRVADSLDREHAKHVTHIETKVMNDSLHIKLRGEISLDEKKILMERSDLFAAVFNKKIVVE